MAGWGSSQKEFFSDFYSCFRSPIPFFNTDPPVSHSVKDTCDYNELPSPDNSE